MAQLRARAAGIAAAVLAVGALSACGGGGGKAASVSTPRGASPTAGAAGSNWGGGTPTSTAGGAAPATGATTGATASGTRSGPPYTGAAAPGGQNDIQTLNQIDNELSSIDASLSTSDRAAAQETN